MHITTAKRMLLVADRLPKKQAQRWLKEMAKAYIEKMERPTYSLTPRQLSAAMSTPE